MEEDYFENLDNHLERIDDNLNLSDEHVADGAENIQAADDEDDAKKKRIVKPKKAILNPRPKLDHKRLKGPRGLCVLEPLFKQCKFKGKGHEVQDLNMVMSVLEHWAHRLFPKMTFDDCLEQIENLGHKKVVSSYVTLVRMGGGGTGEDEDKRDEPDAEVLREESPPPQADPFDLLISQQDTQPKVSLTEEQKARINRNRLLAEERRLAAMKAKYTNAVHSDPSKTPTDQTVIEETS